MGVIIKESIKSSLISYFGVLIGFVNIGILQPRIITIEQIGYIGLITSYAELLAQLFSFGIPSMISKFFPWFEIEKKFKGIKLLVSLFLIIGIITIYIFLTFFYNVIGSEDFKSVISPSFTFKILLFWILSNLTFKLYDSIYKMLFKISLSFFLKDVLQRLMMTIALICYFYHYVDFKGFVFINLIGVAIPGIIILFKILLNPKFDWSYYIPKNQKKEIIKISLYSLIGAIGGIIISQIDKIMVDSYAGIAKTGIYTIMGYYSVIILIPSRTLKKISVPILAKSWKDNDLTNIEKIYKSSAINLFFVGSLILSLLIINTDIILWITGKQFESGITIPIIIGVGYLFDLFTGVNNEIIATSSKYKWTMYFTLGTAIITIIFNLIFIPKLGMIGAAYGTMLTFFVVNILRLIFVYYVFKIHPFSTNILKTIPLFILPVTTLTFLPKAENIMLDGLIKSLLLISLYVILNKQLNISEEINNIINKVFKKNKKDI